MTPFLNKTFLFCLFINALIGFILHIEVIQRTLSYASGLLLLTTFLVLPLVQWHLIMTDITTKLNTLSRFKYIYTLSIGSLVFYYISGFIFEKHNSIFSFEKILTPLLFIFSSSIIPSLIGLLILKNKNRRLPAKH